MSVELNELILNKIIFNFHILKQKLNGNNYNEKLLKTKYKTFFLPTVYFLVSKLGLLHIHYYKL